MYYYDSTADENVYYTTFYDVQDSVEEIDLVTYPNGIEDGFEVIIKVDGIETDYNNLPEVIIWKTL